MPTAAEVYRNRSAQSLPPRAVEAAAFEFVTRGLQAAHQGNDRVAALSRNQKLWSLLLTDVGMTGNALPDILKQDLVTVGSFSIDYGLRAMLSEISLEPLVAINRDMIEALRSSPSPQPGAKPSLVAAAARIPEPISA